MESDVCNFLSERNLNEKHVISNEKLFNCYFGKVLVGKIFKK